MTYFGAFDVPFRGHDHDHGLFRDLGHGPCNAHDLCHAHGPYSARALVPSRVLLLCPFRRVHGPCKVNESSQINETVHVTYKFSSFFRLMTSELFELKKDHHSLSQHCELAIMSLLQYS